VVVLTGASDTATGVAGSPEAPALEHAAVARASAIDVVTSLFLINILLLAERITTRQMRREERLPSPLPHDPNRVVRFPG
jgi:hypothetical protein